MDSCIEGQQLLSDAFPRPNGTAARSKVQQMSALRSITQAGTQIH